MNKNLKQKKCKVCGSLFAVYLSMQKVCSQKCALEYVRIESAKKEKKESEEEDRLWREKKKKINDTVPSWTKKAQAAFNEYIRLRDHDKPCVSCGKYDCDLTTNSVRGGKWDCGHYRSVGACPELRFEPLNAHKQCKRCNGPLSGNHVEYRFGIAARLTAEQLAWVEGPHKPKRYKVDELKEITKKYKDMAKAIENEN